MGLKDQILDDMKAAMRAQEKQKLSVLRMVKSTLMNKEIDKGEDLDEEEILQMLNTLVKQRKDSADQYSKGGRPELAEAEMAEIEIIAEYLPASASSEDIEAAVALAISESGASTMKDMGSVMKLAREKLAGKTVDGKAVSDAIRSKLS